MLWDAMLRAFSNLANPNLLMFMAGGIAIGIIIGILPGIGGITAVILVMPFIFVLTPEQALIFIMSVTAVQFMAGSITAILLNIPGETANAVTMLDGFPMTQKGEAGRALGASMTSSGLGSFLTEFWALAMIPFVLPMVMGLRTADMVFIVLMGLTFIAYVGSGSIVRGLICGGLGIALSLIGYQPVTGVARFTFGSSYLYDGIYMVPLALGLFAIPEMIDLATAGGSIATEAVSIKGIHDVMRGVKDTFRNWWLVLRCSLIGFIGGILPGVGATVGAFLAYGHAKQTSKHPELFGTGIVEGVIAPESAMDAKEGGDLITTLALGIPGSPYYAVVLGVFIMLGLQPGPKMLTEHLDLSLTMIWTELTASLIGCIICLPLAVYLAKVAKVSGRVLAPIIFVIVFLGAYASRGMFPDMLVVLIFGLIGLVMKRYKFNRPALFLGFVLGNLFETYLFIAYQVSGPFFFVRPVSLAIIAVIILLIAWNPVRNALHRRKQARMA